MTKRETTKKAWFYRAALGPAQLLDGLVMTVTVGTFTPGAALAVARKLTRARMESGRGFACGND